MGLSGDATVPADYDGDGITDLAVYRAGTWFVRQSTTHYATSVAFQWGANGDITVPGDYDGDGKADLAVYRPTTGTWFLRLSTTSYVTSVGVQWGTSGDIPVPGDFDGDGRADLAVYRPSTGTWFVLPSGRSFSGAASFQSGQAGDILISSARDACHVRWMTAGPDGLLNLRPPDEEAGGLLRIEPVGQSSFPEGTSGGFHETRSGVLRSLGSSSCRGPAARGACAAARVRVRRGPCRAAD